MYIERLRTFSGSLQLPSNLVQKIIFKSEGICKCVCNQGALGSGHYLRQGGGRWNSANRSHSKRAPPQ